jgi:hypothetical protein
VSIATEHTRRPSASGDYAAKVHERKTRLSRQGFDIWARNRIDIRSTDHACCGTFRSTRPAEFQKRGVMLPPARRFSCRFIVHTLNICCTLTLFSLIRPNHASAQFESFVEKVTDLQISTSCLSSMGDFSGTSCFRNYGVEVLWNLGRFPAAPKPPATSPSKLVRMEVENGDTLFVYEPVPPTPPSAGPYLLEVGVGWGQITEFASREATHELHGSVREIPSVSLYVTKLDHRMQPYVGIRSGIIRLQNAQMVSNPATDTSTFVKTYFGSAEAFQIGMVIGAAQTLAPNLHLMAEFAYHRRYFPSVTWATSPADLPTEFQRSLDFSGQSLSIGLQVKLRDQK